MKRIFEGVFGQFFSRYLELSHRIIAILNLVVDKVVGYGRGSHSPNLLLHDVDCFSQNPVVCLPGKDRKKNLGLRDLTHMSDMHTSKARAWLGDPRAFYFESIWGMWAADLRVGADGPACVHPGARFAAAAAEACWSATSFRSQSLAVWHFQP
jgi:hypothetical protein